MRFGDAVDRALHMLQQRGKVSYRALQLECELSSDELAALRDELVDVLEVAEDRDGRVLVWRGDAAPPPSLIHPEAERRQLTVLFCDLVSSTELAVRIDAEVLRNVIRDYRATVSGVIDRFGGYISQWVGDGVDIYFGYPTAHEDDAQRAVTAGLAILSAIRDVNERLRVARGFSAEVRIGVHTGPVVVGNLETGRDSVLAVGDTPNICARIQALAAPGTLLVSATTHRLVRGYFDFEDLGHHELKGVPRPQRVFRVLGARAVAGRLDAADGLTPLIDREQEREHLHRGIDAVRAGRRGAVLLTGEAGIGKSRLVHWVREIAVAAGWAILDCRCSPQHSATALHPLSDAIARRLALHDAGADAFARIASAVPLDGAVPHAEAAVLLAQLLDVRVPAEQPQLAVMTPQRQRSLTFEAIADLILADAAAQPAVFAVEDLHWVDPSTMECLQLLFQRSSAAPLLLLFTARPEFRMTLPDGGLDQLAVDRLPQEHAMALVRATAGQLGLSEQAVDRLAERTDGVPLFIEEMTRTVLESAAFTAGADDAAAVRAIEEDIPDTLYGCLMARLDRLSDVRVVAQLAATIGRRFDYALLRAVADVDDAMLHRCLRELIDAQLVVQETEHTYAFRHALIKDAAEQALLRSTARAHHGRIADTLLERFPEFVAAHPEQLAHHLTEADRPADAVPRWQEAGLQALQRFATQESIAHFRRALDLLQTLPAGPARDAQEVALRVLVAVPLTLTRGWASPEVEESYRRATKLCETVGETPQLFPALVGLLTYYIVSAQLGTAYSMARRNLQVAHSTGDRALLLEAEHDCGATAVYLGRFEEALGHLERCIRLYDPAQHYHHVFVYGKDAFAVAHVHLAMAHWCLGRPDTALTCAQRALDHTLQWQHPFTQAWSHAALAVVQHNRRDIGAMADAAQQMIAISQQQDFPNWLAQGLVYLGWTEAMSGAHETGIARMREGIGIWRITGARLVLPYLTSLLADGLLHAQRVPEALDTVLESLALSRDTGDGWWRAEIHHLHGRIRLALGDAAAAGVEYASALDVARAQHALGHELRAATALAQLWQSHGRPREAHALLQPVHAAFVEGRSTADVRGAAELLAALQPLPAPEHT
jgi:class 3 adenylate cyclase/predicted ATPase